MIIGQPGSGKSTLARKLGKLLDLPVFYIDQIHWKPGWVERAGPEKDRLCAAVHANDKWVFEGGRSSTWPERLDRADTLIWLDFPLYLRSWRVFMRTVRYYGESRPDLPADCPERFNLEFIQFIWRTRKNHLIADKIIADNMIKETMNIESVRPLFERYMWEMKQYVEIKRKATYEMNTR